MTHRKKLAETMTEIIDYFYYCGEPIFVEFANTINYYYEYIISSFNWVQLEKPRLREKNNLIARISNGPMESFNRKPKDSKRLSRGYSNFDFARNRIIFACRTNPVIRAVPKSDLEIHSYTGKPRGPYKKVNKNR